MQQMIPHDLKTVIRKYGWGRPHRIGRKQNTWFVSSDKGTFFLKKSRISSAKLSVLQKLLAKVHKAGFTELLPFLHTKKGKGVVTHANGGWYATPWKQSSQQSINVIDAVCSLARLHRTAEPLVKEFTSLQQTVDQQWIDQWREKQQVSARINQQIMEKEFPSPFDKSFSNYYDVLDRSLNFAIRGMEKFVKLENGQPPRYTLCHNRIHPSNLIYHDDHFYWVDFDHAVVDSPVRDLAMFIRRFAHLAEPDAILASYQQELALQQKEKRLLALYLAYPERIMKQLHDYDQGVQIAQEVSAHKRLEKEMEKLIGIQHLIIQLWPNKIMKKR